MNAKPLDRRIFETKHAEEGRVHKQATPKGLSDNKYSSLCGMRGDGVIPLPVELVALDL